jgi:hypothetical protein
MIEGLEITVLKDIIDFFQRVPEITNKAARLAINRTVSRDGLKLARQSILDEVAFPKDYLKGDRLRVSRYASESNLEGAILARKRATSLARFASGQPVGQPGRTAGRATSVTVRVMNGKTTVIKNAWLVKLNRGASKDEDNYNIGLALRVRPGDEVVGKKTAHQSWLVKPDGGKSGIALLYGPSVEQVFRDVAFKIGPKVGNLVADEFFRQFTRLTR